MHLAPSFLQDTWELPLPGSEPIKVTVPRSWPAGQAVLLEPCDEAINLAGPAVTPSETGKWLQRFASMSIRPPLPPPPPEEVKKVAAKPKVKKFR